MLSITTMHSSRHHPSPHGEARCDAFSDCNAFSWWHPEDSFRRARQRLRGPVVGEVGIRVKVRARVRVRVSLRSSWKKYSWRGLSPGQASDDVIKGICH